MSNAHCEVPLSQGAQTRKGSGVIRVTVDTGLLEEAPKLEVLTDCVAEMFARICRCSESITIERANTGAVHSEIDTDPGYNCKGCGLEMPFPRWLCGSCRRKSFVVRNGKPFIACAYDGKHIASRMQQGGVEWKAALLCEIQLSDAYTMAKLTRHCGTVCQGLFNANGPAFDVSLRDLAVDVYAAWQRPLGAPSEPWHLCSFGMATRAAVEERVLAWLVQLDDAICTRHGIRVTQATDADEKRFCKIREDIALLLSARSTATEHSECHKRFSTAQLELINKLEYTAVDISAPASATYDRETTATLRSALKQVLALQKEEQAESSATPLPPESDALLVVETQPLRFAELLASKSKPVELDTTTCAMALPGAIDALASVLKSTESDVLFEFIQWVTCFPNVAILLIHQLELAQKRIESWLVARRGVPTYFAETLKFREHSHPHEGTMPRPTWCEINVCADVRTPAAGKYTRLGLSPTGERIVRLASALWQLEGRGVFDKPLVKASLLCGIANAHHARTLSSCETLLQQMKYTQLGRLFERTHNRIVEQDAMVEDDVRGALASMGQFSLQEIATFFAVVLPTRREQIAERIALKLPEIASTAYARYQGYVDDVHRLAAYLLKTQRTAYKDCLNVRLCGRAEVLRSIGLVRILEQRGTLYTTSELFLDYATDLRIRSAGRDFLERCAENRVLCRRVRKGTRNYVCINTHDLKLLLDGSKFYRRPRSPVQ